MSRPKLLILDDEPDFLEVCRELLTGLPSQPEVLTASSGSRALALLESEPFSLLLTDLRMPNMDGFQVLAIVRRRLPSLRIVVMTGAVDEQSRARAYAMGIDLFVEKPKSQKETQLFFECIESMLEHQTGQAGFRGVVQHKALVDILQMECLTQSSAVLKITSGKTVGYIWLRQGEIVDAATGTAKAEAAFKEIFGWKVGSFEILPPDPNRTRSIFTPTQGLFLDTAQSLDEAVDTSESPAAAPLSRMARMGRTRGVDFLVAKEGNAPLEHWSCENAEGVATWAQRMLEEYRTLGKTLNAGPPSQIEGYGRQQHIAIAVPGKATVVAGIDRALKPEQVSEVFEQVLSQWAS